MRRAEVAETGQIVSLQCRFGAAVAVRDEIAKQHVAPRKIVIDTAGQLIQLSLARRNAEKPVAGVGLRHKGKHFLNHRIGYARSLRSRGNLRVQSSNFAALTSFVAVEEERLVLDNRAADRITIDVALKWWNRKIRSIEEILRVQLFVTHKLPSRSVQRICSLFRKRVDDNSCITAVLGAESIRLDL